jgi:AsmA protein
MDITVDSMYFQHPPGKLNIISGTQTLHGKLRLDTISISGVERINSSVSVNALENVFDFGFTTDSRFGSSEQGSFEYDNSKEEPVFTLDYQVGPIPIETLTKDFYAKKLMEGTIGANVKLQAKGRSRASLKSSLCGSVVISGDSLLLYGLDLDDALRKYERSQKFNLVDLTAVVVTGPYAVLATKGTDFVKLATIDFQSTDTTPIQQLLANWEISNGMLMTKDVAFSTDQNRIAFDGTIDLVNDSIPKFTVSVIDRNGCSLMTQDIYGKIGKIQIGKLKIARTILGSVINFMTAVAGIDCKKVYTGRVIHPAK